MKRSTDPAMNELVQRKDASVARMGQGRRVDLVHAMLRQLGAVQLDTISVLARSHELIPYARFGAIGRRNVEDAYWETGLSFEYWSHAACILPMESWPLFAFRRRFFRNRGIRWHEVPDSAVRDVTARLRAEGRPYPASLLDRKPRPRKRRHGIPLRPTRRRRKTNCASSGATSFPTSTRTSTGSATAW